VANSVGLGHDVAPHFALFKDEGHNFGKRTICSQLLFSKVCYLHLHVGQSGK